MVIFVVGLLNSVASNPVGKSIHTTSGTAGIDGVSPDTFMGDPSLFNMLYWE